MLKSYSAACITVVTILLASSVYSLLRGLSGPPRLLKMIHISFASFLRKFITTFLCTYYVLALRHTGKSLSEALIFASTNPQYDDRLFIKVQYMKIPSSNLGRTCCIQNFFLTFRDIQNNFCTHLTCSPPCSSNRRASDKKLPVSRRQ